MGCERHIPVKLFVLLNKLGKRYWKIGCMQKEGTQRMLSNSCMCYVTLLKIARYFRYLRPPGGRVCVL